MEIKVLKLVSGEEFICTLEVKDDFYILTKPQKFLMTQNGIASMPLIPYSKDEKYSIHKDHVILTCEPDDDIKNVYNSEHGSGLVIPKSSILKG
jgi:hypothetical protein